MIKTTYSIFEKNISNPEALFFIESKAIEGFWIWDFSVDNLYLNHLFLKNLGFVNGERPDFTLASLVDFNDSTEFLRLLSDVNKPIILNYIDKNLASISCEVTFLPLKDPKENITGYLFSNTKINRSNDSSNHLEISESHSFIINEIF